MATFLCRVEVTDQLHLSKRLNNFERTPIVGEALVLEPDVSMRVSSVLWNESGDALVVGRVGKASGDLEKALRDNGFEHEHPESERWHRAT